jgi:CBS domain-containing protein
MTSCSTNWEHHHHVSSIWVASSLRADMIFGKDTAEAIAMPQWAGSLAIRSEPERESGSPSQLPGHDRNPSLPLLLDLDQRRIPALGEVAGKAWRKAMNARDVMVSPVITVKPYSSVKEVAKTLLEKHISAVPVVDDAGTLVGIVSEGDLMHRFEAGTERRYSPWIRLIAGDASLPANYIKAHARKVADVMTKNVITASPETPLDEIAIRLERNSIKRVPIVKDGRLVGIVSRANIVQVVASAPIELQNPLSDSTIRDRLLADLKAQSWAHTNSLNVTVNGGVVSLWGVTGSETERKAIGVAAEAAPGVRAVNNHLTLQPAGWGV